MLDFSSTAGDNLVVTFEGVDQSSTLLFYHSYGVIELSNTKKGGMLSFQIPSLLSQYAGTFRYELIAGQTPLRKGNIIIKSSVASDLETYCGPKHILVGGEDFSMLTSLILDELDNPIPNTTDLSAQVGGNIISKPMDSSVLINYTKIFSPKKRGNGAVAAKFGDLASQEFRLEFYANQPEDYQIAVEKQHEYADGIQLVSITSSTIRDQYGNNRNTKVNF
ncbi:MAG: hypothetical protein AAFN93_29305 [Bacteroidota bacterium]